MRCFPIVVLILTAAESVTAQPDSIRFAAFGDYGTNSSREQAVADLVATFAPDFIITTGDNSYGATPIDDNIGKYYAAYIGAYTGAYGPGADTNRFFPSAGNHDYSDGAGFSAYLAYFTLPGADIAGSMTSGNERYYDFAIGPVEFFAINSNSEEPDGVTSTSIQAQWLQMRLSLSTAPWKIVYMHHPPYSSSSVHGSEVVMQWPYEDWGVTAVLTGHDHTYERIVRDDNGDGRVLPYFVTGLGGRTPYSFSSTFVSGSEAHYNADNGSLIIDATPERISFYFYSVADGGTLVDSYSIAKCCTGMRGNVNDDVAESIDISDVTFLVTYMFREGAAPPCPEEADIDGVDGIDVADLAALIGYMFKSGPPPDMCP